MEFHEVMRGLGQLDFKIFRFRDDYSYRDR